MNLLLILVVFFVYIIIGYLFYYKINNKLGINLKINKGKVFLVSFLTTILSNILLGLGLLLFINILGPIFTNIQNFIDPYSNTFNNITFFFVMPITLLVIWYFSYYKLFTLFQVSIIKVKKEEAIKISKLITGKVLIFGFLIGLILEVLVKYFLK